LSLFGSIGLCFAQHLWRVLRQEALPLYRIEQLFTVRSKALVLTNAGVFWTAPLLFSMAVYLWLLEVAVVYPPGALTVVTQSLTSTNNLNMAVVNKPVPIALDPFANNSASEYSLSSEIRPFLNVRGKFHQYSYASEYPGPPWMLTITEIQFDLWPIYPVPSCPQAGS
jgi:hypothetical protein